MARPLLFKDIQRVGMTERRLTHRRVINGLRRYWQRSKHVGMGGFQPEKFGCRNWLPGVKKPKAFFTADNLPTTLL